MPVGSGCGQCMAMHPSDTGLDGHMHPCAHSCVLAPCGACSSAPSAEADFFYVPVYTSCFIHPVRDFADSLGDWFYGREHNRVQGASNVGGVFTAMLDSFVPDFPDFFLTIVCYHEPQLLALAQGCEDAQGGRRPHPSGQISRWEIFIAPCPYPADAVGGLSLAAGPPPLLARLLLLHPGHCWPRVSVPTPLAADAGVPELPDNSCCSVTPVCIESLAA